MTTIVEINRSCYKILVEGLLEPGRELWFEVVSIESVSRPGEKPTTQIVTSLPDQSALLGLLRQLRDLGLDLVSVQRMDERKESI